MVQKLINAREELIKLNKNLEQKVIERTKELELESAASNLKTQEIFVQQTQLEQTQSQLIQAEKLASLGTLVAGVAHEINNPLNFVSISARTLDKELREHKDFLFQLLEGEHEIKKILEPKFDRFFEALIDVNEGGERIKVIVRDLRTFSRLDEEGAEEADVTAGLPSTLRLIKTQYKKDIDFVCDFQAEAILACWPTQLDQVYLNIMSNACQSIQEKQENAENMGQGILTIRTFFPKHKHAGTHLGISFSDTGCGMTDQVISKIFEPFFTTKGVGEGTGMGMSISYGIIEKHNGHIEVESTVGEGTTITILLPLQRKTADPGRGN